MENAFLQSLVRKEDIAVESYGEVVTFIEDPERFLDIHWGVNTHDGSCTYTETLRPDGSVTLSVHAAINDLCKVNAYTSALAVATSYLEKIETVKDFDIPKVDKEQLQNTIDSMQYAILQIMTEKEEYNSKRESVLTKYKKLIDASDN